MLNAQGRKSRPQDAGADDGTIETFSGHRGLVHEEPLLFEQDQQGRSGVDLPEVPAHKARLGGMERKARPS